MLIYFMSIANDDLALTLYQWEFQDPKVKVVYISVPYKFHTLWGYFIGIIYSRYLQSTG